MKTLDDLQAFYDNELKGHMDALEQRRRHAVNGCIIGGGILLTAFLVVGLWAASADAGGCFILVLIGGCILAAGGFRLFATRYRQDFKHLIIRRVIEFMEPGLRYFPELGVSKEQFRVADFFKTTIDRYRSEDLVKGRIGQTDIVFSEVHAEQKVSNGKSSHWVTIFKGLFFIGDFHKHFHGRTVVLPDKAEKWFGALGQKLQSLNFTRGSLIKLEDPEFEREFVVYGDDQIEARYILSPALMERITAFRRKCGTDLYLAFVGSQVFAAFAAGKDMFEPKLFSTAGFDAIIEYAAELRLATDIVEDLNLNTRIWTKT